MTTENRPRHPAWTAMAGMVIVLAGCQTEKSSFDKEVLGEKIFSDETRALERELNAESAALGEAQSAIGMVAAFDPTGIASMAMLPAARAATNAQRRSADARMKAQLDKDQAAFYRRWGMNPDGTPSGKRPPGGVD